MDEVKKEKLETCACGEQWVIVCQIRHRSWLAACKSCPIHVYGSSEEEVRKKWNEEAQKRGNSGKGN